MVKFSDSTHGP